MCRRKTKERCVFNLGLVVCREYLGTTLHRGVVILEVFLDLLHWMGAAAARGMERLTWAEGVFHLSHYEHRQEEVERLRNTHKHTLC